MYKEAKKLKTKTKTLLSAQEIMVFLFLINQTICFFLFNYSGHFLKKLWVKVF